MDGFHGNWLLTEVQNEIHLAEIALNTLQLEIASFLHHLLPPPQHDCPLRAIPLAAVAVGAIGLFGTGIAMGSDDCGLLGIFGTCQSKEIANAINRMFHMAENLATKLQHLKSATNEKVLIVGQELKAIRDLQAQMTEVQNANWHTISQQLDTFCRDIHEMRN